jgi:hypothetical protein
MQSAYGVMVKTIFINELQRDPLKICGGLALVRRI